MDEENEVIEVKIEDTHVDKIAKLALAAVAGYIASRVAENVYDKIIKARRTA